MNTSLNDYFRLDDVSEAIKEMQSAGAVLVPAMLQEPFRELLFQEASALPFKKANEKVGVVDQAFDYCAFITRIPNYLHLEELRCATEELVQRAGDILSDEPVRDWLARDVVINRYGKTGGLGAHKDLKRHPAVIVIWNIIGSCDFELLNDRNGERITVYQPNAGDLILLRGSSACAGSNDQRPFHRVGNIVGEQPRISVTIRHNLNPENPIAGFSYVNV